jgi:hypothetical protein
VEVGGEQAVDERRPDMGPGIGRRSTMESKTGRARIARRDCRAAATHDRVELTEAELSRAVGGGGDMPDGDPITAGKASPQLML